MDEKLAIGIIGDFDPSKASHPATNAALQHAADHLSLKVNVEWLPTPSLVSRDARGDLDRFDGLWASPGSPYRSDEGALLAIKQARLLDKPFLGT